VAVACDRHRPGRMRDNDRAENSHLVIRRRERKRQKFESPRSAQRLLATHAAVYNNFNVHRHSIPRLALRLCRAKADVAENPVSLRKNGSVLLFMSAFFEFQNTG